jgi:hypothetical protein
MPADHGGNEDYRRAELFEDNRGVERLGDDDRNLAAGKELCLFAEIS